MNSLTDLALVLHTIAWRETSLIIEVFTRTQGRLGLIAKGARRLAAVTVAKRIYGDVISSPGQELW